VGDVAAAAAALEPGATAFVTIGRKELAAFAGRGDVRVIARAIEPPGFRAAGGVEAGAGAAALHGRGGDAMMKAEGVSVLVTKNAGGEATRGKLEAARALGLPVIMVARPVKPAAETAATVEEMVERIAASGHIARPRESGDPE
jgi:precorrin-6A/cobalt-precorrin-6A reductase